MVKWSLGLSSRKKTFGFKKDNSISECHAKDKTKCPYHVSHQEMTQKEANDYQERFNENHDANAHALKKYHRDSSDDRRSLIEEEEHFNKNHTELTVSQVREKLLDKDPKVRAKLAEEAAIESSDQVQALAGDSDSSVRLALTKNEYVMSHHAVFSLLHDKNEEVCLSAIDAVSYYPNPRTRSIMYAKALQYSPSENVKEHLAERCSKDVLRYQFDGEQSPKVKAIIKRRLSN
jgi:hypothetical protein